MKFYIGKERESREPVTYKADHLVTHGLIFGMTGSGKTGLAIGLLEEAQLQGVPIIAVDPKGDLANLALSWPGLQAEDFAPWIDPSALKGEAREELAKKVSQQWRDGIGSDSRSGEDIRQMREKTLVEVYTPGSSAGKPVSILDRFEAPKNYENLPSDEQNELISGIVSALLGLISVNADPLQSPEHIFLSSMIEEAWKEGHELTLEELVGHLLRPPITQMGVFAVDDFFPEQKRQALALRLNALLASPGFSVWKMGEPLDVDRMFQGEDGFSRCSIFSIAHLDDDERHSFVTLLLDRVIAWMRSQPGTGGLRALLYMDEVFGYLPPYPKNPPTKRPILTLLKQARAFGLGVLLATQNPVDVDYKSLTNAGTWFVGKLTAERDKERLLDGLMSSEAAKSLSRNEISAKLSGLASREFFLQNAHADRPEIFKTRFCMSYLRGPLTRQEIASLKLASFYNLQPAVDWDARYNSDVRDNSAAREKGGRPSESGLGKRDKFTMERPEEQEADFPRRDTAPIETGAIETQLFAAKTGGSGGQKSRLLTLLPKSSAERLGIYQSFRDLLGGTESFSPYWGFAYAFLPSISLPAPYRSLGSGEGEPIVKRKFLLAPILGGQGEWQWRELRDLFMKDFIEEELLEKDLPRSFSTMDEKRLERASKELEEQFLAAQKKVFPVSARLNLVGMAGESVASFKERLGVALQGRSDRELEGIQYERSSQLRVFDKKLAELKALLEMDQREIQALKREGEEQKLIFVRSRVEIRMAEYKNLRAQRENVLGDLDMKAANRELTALLLLDEVEAQALALHFSKDEVTAKGFFFLPR